MKLRQSFHRWLLRLYEDRWQHRRIFSHLSELDRSQWRSRLELEHLQIERLRSLLAHAFSHCDYYRSVWKERGLNPSDVQSLADFERWPCINRDVIREHRLHMRSTPGSDRLYAKTTGGSSGVPLAFDICANSYARRTAAAFRAYSWAGAHPGTKQWYLWGVPLGRRSRAAEWRDGLYHWIYQRRIANCFGMSDDTIADYLADLNRYRPTCIVAYTNPLYFFARALDERRLRPHAPESIIVGAEKLHDFQREAIAGVFQAPLFETYGSREFTLIAAECERHQGMHLTTENLVVEILDDEGRRVPAGQEGDVVITDLTNFGMPFIRYRNGDRAVAGVEQCSCGRGLPLLKKVVGRRLDVIHTPGGRHVPGEFFPHLLKDFPDVRRFQVIQVSPGSLVLRLVVGEGWTRESQRRLEHEVRSAVAEEMSIEFEFVDQIQLTPAGKWRVVVNQCQPEGNRK
jgi:phenylacetate-CoA ligase